MYVVVAYIAWEFIIYTIMHENRFESFFPETFDKRIRELIQNRKDRKSHSFVDNTWRKS